MPFSEILDSYRKLFASCMFGNQLYAVLNRVVYRCYYVTFAGALNKVALSLYTRFSAIDTEQMKLFKKEKTLYLKYKEGETTDELLQKLHVHISDAYPSCKLRGNYLEFEKSSMFKPTTEKGAIGSVELFEEEEWLRAGVSYGNPLTAASTILLLVITTVVGVVAFINGDDEDSWMYLVFFPLFGLAVGAVQALLFQLIGSYHFNKLLGKVRFNRDEVVKAQVQP